MQSGEIMINTMQMQDRYLMATIIIL